MENNGILAENARPQLYGLKAVGERVSIGEDGVQTIHTKIPTVVYLFGHLIESINVTFTRRQGTLNEDCSSLWLSGALQSTPIQDGVGRVLVTLGEADDYYVCIHNTEYVTNVGNSSLAASNAVWLHQGSSEHITIRAVEKLLPVWLQIGLILLLLTMSGLFSGLNLGLMALDRNELKVISRCGTELEKRYAKTIEPVRARGNYLLCTLLFGNVLVNSTLTILMDDLTSGLIAILVSTLSIVVFGEIIPQAICSRHGLAVGAKTIFLTYLFMILTFPLSYPISKLLDKLLGDEIGNVYDRERLMEYIKVTKTYNKLEEDEMNIISGALCLKTKTAGEVMTKLEDAFMLPITAVLDFNTVSEISKKGYSRIPVYDTERKNIVALLHAKDLAFVDPDDKKPLKTLIEFYKHPLIHTYADETLNNVLNHFKHGKSHMAFVRQIYDTGDEDPFYEITGLVTLEDVIEEILQMEIVDETDILTDNRKKQKRKEAQVHQDFSEFAKIGEGEIGKQVLSPQMYLATFQYLSTAIEPFSKKYISETVLRRLIGQKIYYCIEPEEFDKNELALNWMSSGTEEDLPQTLLYQMGKPADYFIMILEGRVRVVVGNERLTYESGPFTYFGVSALRPPEILGRPRRSESISVSTLPNMSSGNPIANTSNNANSRPPSPESVPLLAGDQSTTISALVANTGSRPSSPDFSGLVRSPSASSEMIVQPYGSSSHLPSIAANVSSFQPNSNIFSDRQFYAQSNVFIPDFSVQALQTTVYIKIPRKVYLAAVRASLLDRRDEFVDNELEQFREEVDSLIYSQLASKSITQIPPPVNAARIKKSSSDILREKKFSLAGASPKLSNAGHAITAGDSTLSSNMIIGNNSSNSVTKRKGSMYTSQMNSPKSAQKTLISSLSSESAPTRPGSGSNSQADCVVVDMSNKDLQAKFERAKD